MAKSYGTPGVLLELQASKRFERFCKVLVFACIIYGGIIGYAIAQWTLLASLVGIVSAMLLFWVLGKLLDRYYTPVEQERRRFIHGARGEQFVGWLLEDLSDDWHVFHSIQLRERGDLDHIAIGPPGLFYINTKSHRGLFSKGPAGDLLYNTKATSELSKITAQAADLRERLAALMGTPNLYVNAVLAAPFAFVDVPGRPKGVYVLHRENLTETLEHAPKRLNKQQIEAYVRAVEILASASRDIVRSAAKAEFPSPPPKPPQTQPSEVTQFSSTANSLRR